METIQIIEKKKPQHKAKKKKSKKEAIPAYLVKEVIDGKSYYYKGYKYVLNGQKKIEDIMGCSGLQSVIITYLLRVLFKCFNEQDYWVCTNEVGTHIQTKVNLANDIAVYDTKVLTASKITKKYIDVPPLLIVEVDVDVALENESQMDYVLKKTQKVLDFGVQRIIWVLLESKKVLVANARTEQWTIVDWSKDIEICEGQVFNVGAYLTGRGIEF